VSRDWRVALDRIVLCAERVLTYTDGLDYAAFLTNHMVYDATLRNLELMGEAAKRVPPEIRERLSDVPWRAVIGFRDRLAHGYDALDDEVIWQAVRDGVPRVLAAARRALADADREAGDA
jgi:uncharacterized protein with HEPN domain